MYKHRVGRSDIVDNVFFGKFRDFLMLFSHFNTYSVVFSLYLAIIKKKTKNLLNNLFFIFKILIKSGQERGIKNSLVLISLSSPRWIEGGGGTVVLESFRFFGLTNFVSPKILKKTILHGYGITHDRMSHASSRY